MNKTITVACILILALNFAGFSSEKRQKGRQRKIDCSARVEKAVDRYNKGRYNEVRTILTDIRFQCGGHSVIDTALYYLGMSNLNGKLFAEAQGEFERLIQSFPNSSYYRETLFRVAQCVYLQSRPYDRSQVETREAIRKLTDFIDSYPSSDFVDSANSYLDLCYDKLARKEYETGRFYQRIDEHDAALIYLRSVIREYPESAYISDAHFQMARSLIALNRFSEALTLIEELKKGSYGEDISRRAQALEARKNLRRR